MASNAMGPQTSILGLRMSKCSHMSEKCTIAPVENRKLVSEVYELYHPEIGKNVETTASVTLTNGDKFEVSTALRISDIIKFDIKYLNLSCKELKSDPVTKAVKAAANMATKQTVNAFEVLMGGKKCFPSLKTKSSGMPNATLSRKDELFNDLIEKFIKPRNLQFSSGTVHEEGKYVVQVLCNALWYITNQHTTLNDAARYQKNVYPVPDVLSGYQGFNSLKRKKLKALPMKQLELESHGQALYSLLQRPVMKSSTEWHEAAPVIEALAKCLLSYKEYLDKKNSEIQKIQNQDHPARTIAEDATIEHRKLVFVVAPAYSKIDTAMRNSKENDLVFFNESEHLDTQFESNLHRFRFFQKLELSVPLDMIRFCPGGSIYAITCLIKEQP